jgi:metal-dependent amidase/aminoacylase/carboxypeptidase family protein
VARNMVHWRRDIHVHLELSGHDAHTAMLTGAAEVLAAREKRGEARRDSGGWTKRPAPPPHPP